MQKTRTKRENREKRNRDRKVDAQANAQAARAAFGASGRPAPVTVRRIDSDDVVVVDASRFARKVYAQAVEAVARDAGYEGYGAYLISASWRKTRKRAVAEAGHRCGCGSTDHLQVHHRTYVRLGAELPGDLEVVCGPCHRRRHGR